MAPRLWVVCVVSDVSSQYSGFIFKSRMSSEESEFLKRRTPVTQTRGVLIQNNEDFSYTAAKLRVMQYT
jgi:hypothetical protein